MKHTLLSLLMSILALGEYLAPAAEAGVLTRNQRSITSRFRRRPRMHLNTRYPTSSNVLRKTNPSLKSGGGSLNASKQIQVRQQAEEEYRQKYAKWRNKQIKVQQRAIMAAKKEQSSRWLRLKKARETERRKMKKAESIREAPLNPWSGSKKAKEPGVIDLKKEKVEDSKPKDATRRTPLLKQLWHAIFG